jgi:superfamily II DNA/RNA helicase
MAGIYLRDKEKGKGLEVRAVEPAEKPMEKPAAGGFEALGVDPRFTGGLGERGILVPTEIQSRVIPRLLKGENLVFSSATGTGKTLAYLLPLLTGRSGEKEEPGRKGILILAPTYELASQIKGELDLLLKPAGGALLLVGSGNMGRQIDSLKRDKPPFLAGNPGRVLALARMGKLRFRGLRALVLDEGDRLTSDELLEETRELILMVRKEAGEGLQRVSASATLSAKSRERLTALLAAGGPPGRAPEVPPGTDPGTLKAETLPEGRLFFEVGDRTAVLRDFIEHWALFSEGRAKIKTLRSFIAAVKPGKTLIFTARGGQAGHIAAQLRHHGLMVGGLWGDMNGKDRKRILGDFRSGRVPCLVTSDLAARGLDIPDISHVIALDLEGGGEAYLHRAGRTARAGKRGVMVTIGDGEEMLRLERLEKALGIKIYPKELYRGRIGAPFGGGSSERGC